MINPLSNQLFTHIFIHFEVCIAKGSAIHTLKVNKNNQYLVEIPKYIISNVSS